MVSKEISREKIAILIANPSPHQRVAIINMLKHQGFKNFDQASDGAEAFYLLKRRPINIIIAHRTMPQMDGITLLKVLSADEELNKIPCLLITPLINKETAMEAGKYGVAGIIVQPVNPEILGQKVQGLLSDLSDPKNVKTESLFVRAARLTKEKKYDEALVLYRDVLNIHEDADIYYNIGYIKTAQGKFDEALIAFRKAVMINNVHARAFKMMGKVHLRKGDPEEAQRYFEKAGELFMERDMDKEAEEVFKEVLKISPDTVNIYNSLGIIYRRQQNYLKAIKLYKVAVEVSPDDENIYFNLGRALLENKEIAEAKKAFESALVINPDFEEAKKMLQAIEVGF